MTKPHPVIKPQPGILSIAPYVGGESAVPGANRAIKLSSNENPYGPSPRAVAAYAAAADRLAIYPDGGHARLRAAIAEVEGLEPERIICGAGSDEIISMLCQAYAGPGDEVLHTEHGFGMYRISALAAGATPVEAPEKDMRTDVDALLAACTERTRLIFVANPNNPTGTLVGADEIARLARLKPARALLVLDGAYAEYVRAPGYDAGARLARMRDDVVMTRTFSKIHGLAALRIGWAYAPDHVIDALDRIRGPFNLSTPALEAGEAAIRDLEWRETCALRNEVWRDWLAKRLAAAGMPCLPSEGNFLLAHVGAGRVERMDAFFKARGVILRKVAGYKLPEHIRITVGDEEACRLVAELAARFAREDQEGSA
ncbi:histidinol-phosphate transaminase [Oceanicella actignis]|uniref:Histidinol-phosphate aminotransferase n=1 Tax=Oceanicella actignis TaxID=1189325 RepID=A0A1M7SHN5_9RHOB|nr:histidinol-phosphate transaminase [Oceanicella actignis]TYO91208.1 histidinol-phosphate aminotransferase [Oceanicella actignis]SET19272.1 histidinol-phosphate aminotransferase [Oceanicella actignis]SHN57954.1 histidinol-phosphate aminotransferase [Oceanicella actignis]